MQVNITALSVVPVQPQTYTEARFFVKSSSHVGGKLTISAIS